MWLFTGTDSMPACRYIYTIFSQVKENDRKCFNLVGRKEQVVPDEKYLQFAHAPLTYPGAVTHGCPGPCKMHTLVIVEDRLASNLLLLRPFVCVATRVI